MPETPENLEPGHDSPFALLGLPPVFTIDEAALERAWLKKSARLHPDRTGDDPDAARALARINAARAVIRDPESRARALLDALGGAPEDSTNALPDGFLMDIFEIRSDLEAARTNGDAQTIEEHESWARARRDEHIAQVAQLFETRGDPPQADVLRSIRLELNAWRYIERLLAGDTID